MRARPIPPVERPDPLQLLATALLLAAAYLPLLPYLEWRISLFVLGLATLRIAALRWPRAIPGPWLLALLTLAGVANCFQTYHTLVGQQGGTALLVTMLALKLLELRTRRDLRLSVILLGFLVVVQFLFDQSPLLVLYQAAVAIGIVALLIDLNGGLAAPGELARLRQALRIALRLSLQALPLTLVLFVLFPRLNAPLWSLGTQPDQGRTGISDQMEPGAISELALSGELAFRARFDTPPPNPERLYWRGPVLWHMDGRRWSPDGPGALPGSASGSRMLSGSDRQAGELAKRPPALATADEPLTYEVLLEPSDQRWLFALDLPIAVPDEGQFQADFQWRAEEAIRAARRYRVTSALVYRTTAPDAATRARALQLPDNITPRMRELAADWRARAATDQALIDEALRFFNRENFHYTLLPPGLGDNPTDAFLFETRRGFCEHYASGFALLMRIAGLPARVVIGYLGSDFNPIGGYHMIWQSDAHAWVEVALPGQGWVRVDPTAAVHPSRIDNQGAANLLGGAPSVRFTAAQIDTMARLFRQWRLFADSLDAAWENWVLDFSSARQLALLERLGLGAWREYGLAGLMVAAIALTLGLLMLALLRDRRPRDPLEAQYARLCRRLARAGLPRRPGEGPRDFGARVGIARPDLAPAVAAFLAIYLPARFGANPSPAAWRRLAACLRDLHPGRQRPYPPLPNPSPTRGAGPTWIGRD